MSTPAFWQDLVDRGIVQQTTSSDLGNWMADRMADRGLAAYCGFDPTAESLHVGSLMPVLGLRRLRNAGIRPIALVGGATGMIGDPSGKSSERSLLDADTLDRNVAGITHQLEMLLQGKAETDFLLRNNQDWFTNIRFTEFLRDIGKHFSVNMMIAKDSVRARLEDRDQGISYTEFSYMLLQAYDFLHLYRTEGCQLQVGGGDQWGNIAVGIDLIHRKIPGAEAHGVTFPLITTSSGQKFGKSEQGTIWLDRRRTHPYFLYKYFFNTADADVVRFLDFFTFRSADDRAALADATRERPQDRQGTKALARDVTGIVHGDDIAAACEGLEAAMHADDEAAFETHARALQLLDPASLSAADRESGDLPVAHRSLLEIAGEGIAAVDLAVAIGLFGSKGEVRREIQSGSGGFRVGGKPVESIDFRITADLLGSKRVLQFRRGKKNKRMVLFHEQDPAESSDPARPSQASEGASA